VDELKAIKEYERIILGIDPGTIVMGYGLIGINKKKAFIISLGVVKLAKLDDPMLKLAKIFERTVSLIDQYHPDELAIEAPFFGKNVQSMLKLGRAQGVAISAALSREMQVNEYSPKKIKAIHNRKRKCIQRAGSSHDPEVLGFKETPEFLDATDGLAAAYCHFLQSSTASIAGKAKNYNSWKSFLSENPEKLKKG
jgi:crossover junction endodeoxyribonuclease RuvC